ncbi:glycine-rich cell wall structural protein, putative [Trichomonas vaginalis G3]|uniref:receptor protein-tyrosine kinase n=1 Tax=Trichomonas vaginalis (strain ATCC PRA-98 / G3) TaxID=412133 RepID=A2E5U6_TRIV3|nr:glycine-rich protein family [Trichomonas vaginalis G3]EAY12016.1 glycine-rich cell wall structural protein, putative [Trichomonas vaginalis G3]KAI5524755.1 glycine-rich protein family [Trichomonas vaginalis G3]|eukprot:XP_001324239.1 glycine-rich cell wall structural protein [Trichomonas vaginalis G3]
MFIRYRGKVLYNLRPSKNSEVYLQTTALMFFSFGLPIFISIYNYNFTGKSIRQILPIGKYKLQVWGAQGGGDRGGRGGYSEGILDLRSETNVYINVGGPGYAARNEIALGGFNGGGSTESNSEYGRIGCSGGGGTDIRVIENDPTKRIIVAGGGGGQGFDTSHRNIEIGGYGGGIKGGKPKYQSEGFAFWKGGNGPLLAEEVAGMVVMDNNIFLMELVEVVDLFTTNLQKNFLIEIII